jgi:hypothetical protein
VLEVRNLTRIALEIANWAEGDVWRRQRRSSSTASEGEKVEDGEL